LNVPDKRLVEQIASALGTVPGLVEKDSHVVRALGVLAGIDHGNVRPAFSGGTSLSIGWGLIKRFSEDIDFKVTMPTATSNAAARVQRRDYREKVVKALATADFKLLGEPQIGNEGKFFAADFAYQSQFDTGPGLRAHLRVEMTFQSPALPAIAHPIQSLVSRAQKQAPEIAAFDCVDPIETAADKLSALAWRVCARERGTERDDPTIIRHLHDLAALEQRLLAAPVFATVLRGAIAADADRGGDRVPKNPSERFDKMIEQLATDPLWGREYDEFVRNVSFTAPAETISFAAALEAARRLVDQYKKMQEAGR
jgi:predicted nucleotidyltransferase component of viral defense system